MATKKITLETIAEKAGVSISTVSRVINGTENVDSKVLERVKKILKETGYYNKIKKQKIRNKNKFISLIVPDITNPFFANIIESVQSTANLYGYHIILTQAKENKSIYDEYTKCISNIGVVGCILTPSIGNIKYLENILKNGDVPVIFLDRKVDIEGINYVGSDNEVGSYNATKYLINLGHTKIIYLAGSEEISTEQERHSGFIKALKEHNINFDYDNFYKQANYDFEESYKQIKISIENKINKKMDFSAIFSTSDSMCFGAKKAIEEAGLSIPNDISLLGYDNIPFSSAIGLTTVSTQVYEIGKNAVLSLLNIINERIEEPVEIILQSNIVIRSSCKKT